MSRRISIRSSGKTGDVVRLNHGRLRLSITVTMSQVEWSHRKADHF